METQIDDLYGTFSFEQGKAIEINGPISNAIEKGKIFIADEFNLAKDNILQSISIILESSNENSQILIPGLGKICQYNKKFFFIACQNDIQTKGRRKLPEIIEKRLRIFEYPNPDEEDIKKSCKDIADNELFKNDAQNYVSDVLASKIAKFMYLINQKNEPEIGIWSMRNIRKIFRRIKNQQINKESYKNITYEDQIVFFILQSIIPEKRLDILERIILPIMKDSFDLKNDKKENIVKCIKSTPKIKKNKNQSYLFKENCGILIPSNISDLSCELPSLLESLFYLLFCHSNEPLLLAGQSSFKTYLAKKILINPPIINLY